jgi:3-hydroxybutyryl-CoA dehydrogenase
MSSESPVRIEDIQLVAVLGAGTMGHGIAQVAAQAGYRVIMQDISDDAVKAGRARIASNLDKGVDKGKVTPEARTAALAAIGTTTEIAEAVRAADVVIEAAPEKLDLKREIFAVVAEHAPARALLATNTSSLSIARVAAATPRPSHVVGMHFFNPVFIMKLVEVVRHDGADPAAVACAVALAERMGKTPITVADAPGFASSRLGLVLGLEAMRMLEQGVASAADIDTAMKLGYGHPMGPLELTDLVGLDVRCAIADYLAEQIGEHFRPPEILRAKVAAGELGKKTGAGFYRWHDGKPS